MEELKCKYCGDALTPAMNFCPHCGKAIKPGSITSISEQIKAYLVCLLLPPFGFYYTYRFFKYGGRKGVVPAIMTIILNIGALIFMIWLAQATIVSLNETMKSLNNIAL